MTMNHWTIGCGIGWVYSPDLTPIDQFRVEPFTHDSHTGRDFSLDDSQKLPSAGLWRLRQAFLWHSSVRNHIKRRGSMSFPTDVPTKYGNNWSFPLISKLLQVFQCNMMRASKDDEAFGSSGSFRVRTIPKTWKQLLHVTGVNKALPRCGCHGTMMECSHVVYKYPKIHIISSYTTYTRGKHVHVCAGRDSCGSKSPKAWRDSKTLQTQWHARMYIQLCSNRETSKKKHDLTN